MYSNEDLDNAVEKGIFSKQSVDDFRQYISSTKNSPIVDEENFRLISGFNDIFVVIACGLLLISALWVLNGLGPALSTIIFTAISWGLAEFFVRQRKMALPAIVLLLTFVGGTFASTIFMLTSANPEPWVISLAAGVSAIAAWLHWQRFHVPITVAAGAASLIALIIAIVLSNVPASITWIWTLAFVLGVCTFAFAMYWDSSDTTRTTRRSDVAFWLHLLSAPLIIHPVFSSLGIFDGSATVGGMSLVILLYLLMTMISVAVDRRAFMVSSLIYVLYAISNLLEVFGGLDYSFALTGVIIGSALLMLSAFWHRSRVLMFKILPTPVKSYLPVVG
ncbi:hypothetical protein [Thalassotalea crassostreae]|uniref:hypothetical protein n=1 Tax=Thalassotalea crassostreae TaxID=1763536 RepID=UPI0008380784|nr:hypothetical protein [Thalassotalea crassostreae]